MTHGFATPALDDALGGGLQPGTTATLRAPPGVEATALAASFCRAGRRDGDRCWYVGSDPPVGRDAGVTALTVLAGDAGGPAVLTEDGDRVAAGDGPLGQRVSAVLAESGWPDRLVLDARGTDATWAVAVARAAAQTDATLLLLSESDALPGATTRLSVDRETVRGSRRALLTVRDHPAGPPDDRPLDLHVRGGDLAVTPVAAGAAALAPGGRLPTDVPGLDALLGGGLVLGAGVYLAGDGRAATAALHRAVLVSLLRRDYAVTLVPTLHLSPIRLDRLLADVDASVADLFAQRRLFVVDPTGAWDTAEDDVFAAESGDDVGHVAAVLDEAAERADGRRATVASANALLDVLGEDARELRYHQETLPGPEDALVHVGTSAAMTDRDAAFFEGAATQVLETWRTADGRQYVSPTVTPAGAVGAVAPVEHRDDPPYLHVAYRAD